MAIRKNRLNAQRVLIAFRLQSEFGQEARHFLFGADESQVLIAFRLQSEFGPAVRSMNERITLVRSLNRLSASVRIWTEF